MKLYYHPLSSYSQKTLMAFQEKGVSFTSEIVDLMSPEGREAYKKIYPLAKIPLLVLDDGWFIRRLAVRPSFKKVLAQAEPYLAKMMANPAR